MAKIVIDAGHGGHDPGAIGKHSNEKTNVLKVALRLKTLLEGYGHTVKLTRSTDVFVGLSDRARDANRWGAQFFISLHNNAAVASASGFETFIFNKTTQAATIAFQKPIHAAIAKNIGIKDRGMKRANFAVLRETSMPAVLIEYAFISHADDEKILINKVEQLAQWTAEGVANYFGHAVKPTPQPSKPTPKPPAKPAAPSELQKAIQYVKDAGISDGSNPTAPLLRGEFFRIMYRQHLKDQEKK